MPLTVDEMAAHAEAYANDTCLYVTLLDSFGDGVG